MNQFQKARAAIHSRQIILIAGRNSDANDASDADFYIYSCPNKSDVGRSMDQRQYRHHRHYEAQHI